MRDVPRPAARRAGLRTLAGAGLWILAGCGVVVDEPQFDTRAEQRPGTWVSRLESEIAGLRGAYEDMIVRATPAQRRRLPSIDSELSRLADAAASMKDDLDWKRGRFGDHLAKAESLATSIDQQLSGAPVTSTVRSRWWDTAYALGYVREFYRALGPRAPAEVQDDPRESSRRRPLRRARTTTRRSRSTRCGGATTRYGRRATRRPAGRDPWTSQLDQELASLGDPVSGLGRVNAGERGAVAPAAERVRQQVERVRPLVEAHEAELPRAMLEAWEQMFGVVRSLGKP
jgi:hypothetical protein